MTLPDHLADALFEIRMAIGHRTGPEGCECGACDAVRIIEGALGALGGYMIRIDTKKKEKRND